jgi:hypothetical protein
MAAVSGTLRNLSLDTVELVVAALTVDASSCRRLQRRLATAKLLVAVLAVGSFPRAGQTQLESIHLTGPATKLLSVTYWDPPNDRQVRVRLSGAEMVPLPNSQFNVKQLAVEQFTTAGKLQAVVEAPQCVYAPFDGVASSPGHLRLRLMDGRITVDGDGFIWRQSDNSLDISNNVSTLVKTGTWKPFTP